MCWWFHMALTTVLSVVSLPASLCALPSMLWFQCAGSTGPEPSAWQHDLVPLWSMLKLPLTQILRADVCNWFWEAGGGQRVGAFGRQTSFIVVSYYVGVVVRLASVSGSKPLFVQAVAGTKSRTGLSLSPVTPHTHLRPKPCDTTVRHGFCVAELLWATWAHIGSRSLAQHCGHNNIQYAGGQQPDVPEPSAGAAAGGPHSNLAAQCNVPHFRDMCVPIMIVRTCRANNSPVSLPASAAQWPRRFRQELCAGSLLARRLRGRSMRPSCRRAASGFPRTRRQ